MQYRYPARKKCSSHIAANAACAKINAFSCVVGNRQRLKPQQTKGPATVAGLVSSFAPEL
jgi:hypothetical protein